MVLTPDGKISPLPATVSTIHPKILRLGFGTRLRERKIGGRCRIKFFSYCYHYDPATGKYGAIIINVSDGSPAEFYGVHCRRIRVCHVSSGYEYESTRKQGGVG